MDPALLAEELARVMANLRARHRDADDAVMRRFQQMQDAADCAGVDQDRQLLIGAYFSEEYAFESAALFNPSIILDENQNDLPAGGVRFIMSLRGIGEGHLSSVTFRTGQWDPAGGFSVQPASPIAVATAHRAR